MAKQSIEAVRGILLNIGKGSTDTERARRTALLKKLPPATRIASIVEAAGTDVELRRAAPLAIANVGGAGKAKALAAFLLDVDPRTRTNAAEVMFVYPDIARKCVTELADLVKIELPRTRKVGALGPALAALGAAQTPSALDALNAIPPDAFKTVGLRGQWLEALSKYRSGKVKPILSPFLASKLPKERGAAIIGLLRNGRSGLLSALRAELDDSDFDAARRAHDALGTKFIFNPSQLASLKRWWDGPNDLAQRLQRLQSGPKPDT